MNSIGATLVACVDGVTTNDDVVVFSVEPAKAASNSQK